MFAPVGALACSRHMSHSASPMGSDRDIRRRRSVIHLQLVPLQHRLGGRLPKGPSVPSLLRASCAAAVAPPEAVLPRS